MSAPNDEGPALATPTPQEQTLQDAPIVARAGHSGQALRVLEGEKKARLFIARLQAQQAQPDELAVLVAMLYGAELRGLCSVLTKALRAPGEAQP
ncbi:MAG: hypothetical protein Q8M01_15850 [Rubrivivax sp.]|nr:hypothetical protein [Rubrivivax sp.]